MAPKPHRLLLDRVSAYAEEAGAYLRRRRMRARPFARVYRRAGRQAAYRANTATGRDLFAAAAAVIDAAEQ